MARARTLVESLFDEPVDEAEARNTVKKLGINVAALASRLRKQVEEQDRRDRKARFEELERQRIAEVARLAASAVPEDLSRPQMLAMLSTLVERAGPLASVHYMKFEEATEGELLEMIRGLRHLVGDEER